MAALAINQPYKYDNEIYIPYNNCACAVCLFGHARSHAHIKAEQNSDCYTMCNHTLRVGIR